jgi:hypothetical protein
MYRCTASVYREGGCASPTAAISQFCARACVCGDLHSNRLERIRHDACAVARPRGDVRATRDYARNRRSVGLLLAQRMQTTNALGEEAKKSAVPRLFILPHAPLQDPELLSAHVHDLAQDAHATRFDALHCAKCRRCSRSKEVRVHTCAYACTARAFKLKLGESEDLCACVSE